MPPQRQPRDVLSLRLNRVRPSPREQRHSTWRRPHCAGAHRGQRRQCGLHGFRVRVVRIVDDDETVGTLRHLHAPAADCWRLAPTLPRLLRGRGRARGPRQLRQVRSRRGGHRATTARPRPRRRAVSMRKVGRANSSSTTSTARISACAPSPKVTTRAPGPRRHGDHGIVISVQHRETVVRKSFDEFALGLRYRGSTAELAEMRSADVEHDADVRPRDPAEVGDVVESACAVFKDHVLGVASARSTVSGSPTSVLNDPSGATVGPSLVRSWPTMSFVLVLPLDPVIPTTTGLASRWR